MKNSSKNVSPYAIGHSNKKKMLSDYNSSPTADDIILGSSSKPEEKRTDHGEKVKVLPHLSCALFLPVPMFSLSLSVTPLPSLSQLFIASLDLRLSLAPPHPFTS